MSIRIAAEPSGGRHGRPAGWRFIDLAGLGINTWGSYGAALLRIVLYPLACTALLALFGVVVGPRLEASWAPVNAVVLQFGPIVVAGAALLRGVVHSHRRPWRSLVAADLRLDWRRLAIGGGVEFAILGGQLALVQALTGWTWRFSIPPGLPVFALAVFLIPLQAASEEALFRGYLTQALGRLIRSRVLIAAAVGLVFGLLHFNAHGPLTIPYFFVFSLIFSLVSLRDERLELTIGGHAAVNLFGFGVANLTVLGPGVVGLDPAALPFNWAAIVVLIVNGAIFYGLTRLLVRRFCERGSVA
jgi:membrane protease YdiL (CAAX protease family)